MIQQEVNGPTFIRISGDLQFQPDDQSEHHWQSVVADNDDDSKYQEDEIAVVERGHALIDEAGDGKGQRIRRNREQKESPHTRTTISRGGDEERPPGLVDHPGLNARILNKGGIPIMDASKIDGNDDKGDKLE